MTTTDPTIAMREGERIDVTAVDAYLKQHLTDLAGTPAVTQFPSGASNLTYRFAYPDQTLILRRPPFGPLPAGAHDVAREARLMQALEAHYPRVPRVRALCTDPAVMGCDFYVMTELPGLILRRELPGDLDTPDRCRALCERYIEGLVELHRVPVAGTPLAEHHRGPGYVARQVDGWTRRLAAAATDDVPAFDDIGRWLAGHQPTDRSPALIHNDYRIDNLVLDPASLTIRGVLDWELATVGDPLMDLGTALAYWVEADDHPAMLAIRPQPTHRPGMLSRAGLVSAYFTASGEPPVDFRFYEVYGLFRLAGILQQIYARYRQGQTHNERFAGFGQVVAHLHQRCQQAIQDAPA